MPMSEVSTLFSRFERPVLINMFCRYGVYGSVNGCLSPCIATTTARALSPATAGLDATLYSNRHRLYSSRDRRLRTTSPQIPLDSNRTLPSKS